MITPNQIKDKILSTASHGYNIDETNEFLDEIAESYAAIYAENKELYRKMEILASKIEEYRAEEDSIKSTLITAQKAADQLTKGTKEKAEALISESTSKAQQTVLDAKEKAEKLVSEARDYVSDFTKEKTDEANAVLADAHKKAEAEINEAKGVASDLLAEVKNISTELVEKAKEEKEYHENLVSKLKEESVSFKERLVSLYQVQLEKLSDMMEFPADDEKAAALEQLENTESELENIYSAVDELDLEIKTEEEEPAQDESKTTESVEESNIEEQEVPTEFEDVSSGADVLNAEPKQESDVEQIGSFDDDDEVEEIIEEVEEKKEEEPSEEEVKTALDAFTKDEITPITEDAKIREIEENAELEQPEEQPFESFFNVKHPEGRTTEKISLVPPEEDDEEEEDLKFHGFFRKKKDKNK